MYSAEIAGDEEDEETAKKNEQLTEEELSAKKAKEDKQFKWLLYITVAVSMVVSVAAFMFLPYILASLIRKVGASEFLVTVVEAFVKLALFMGYMFLISRMKDIQRTFMYHGAEHKCINCVEHGLPLTVENVLKSSRLHKRCGTSFSVPGHAGKHCAALCVCAGPGLLGKTVWKTSYGTGSCGNLFLRSSSGQEERTVNLRDIMSKTRSCHAENSPPRNQLQIWQK